MFHQSSVAALPSAGQRLSSYPVELICRELEARGLDPAPVLACHGADRSSFHALTGKLPAERIIGLGEDLIAFAGDPLLALRSGCRVDLADYGLFGLLIRSSPDFSTAVGHYRRYNDRRPGRRAFNVDAVIQHDGVVLHYLDDGPGQVPTFLHDAFASVMVALTRLLFCVGPAWVELAFPEPAQPAEAAEYARLLGAPVRFGMPVSRLLLPASSLQQGFPHGDGELARLLEPHVVGPGGARPVPGADLVRTVQSLLTISPGTPPLTMTQVAERLATSERTLRRHLFAAGTTFHDLLDQSRHRHAVERVLNAPGVTGADLATHLGYTDPPAFYRAFKRWTGMPLTEYRIRACTPGARSPGGATGSG